MRIDVLSLFPRMFEGVLTESIVKIAQEKGLLEVELTDFRQFAGNRWGKVDDRPYGGGPGMVLQCGPIYAAFEALLGRPVGPGEPPVGDSETDGPGVRAVMLTPQGRRLDQALVNELAGHQRLLLLCGHYEGFDERVRQGLAPTEVSIGDYVLSGGEPAAIVLIDAIARLLDGALGDAGSVEEESFGKIGELECGIEYPHYTRPPEFRGLTVPEVLLSGHHAQIAQWREQEARTRTKARRPDLLEPEEHTPDR